jgi:death-on-curing family protein
LRSKEAVIAVVESAKSAAHYTDGDLFEVAAAYMLYVNQRHPWNDGNQRVSLAACIRFLSWNGVPTMHSSKELEQLTLSIANEMNQTSRETIAKPLRILFT